MWTCIFLRQEVGGKRKLLLLLLLATFANGQFYGRSLPCPTSYLDPDGDCIPGIVGKDYPAYATFPKTQFKCSDHSINVLGYFADPSSSCQAFHVCLNNGHQESFLCPNGTLFSQQFLVCDWWFNVKCNDAYKFYQINDYLQAPINFHQGPVHPNAIPIPSYSNLRPIEKMDNFDQMTSSDNNNNEWSNPRINSEAFGSSPSRQDFATNLPNQENGLMYSEYHDYGVMPRRPVISPEEIQTTTTTTTTTTTAEPTASPVPIGWSMLGLKEMSNVFSRRSDIGTSTFPPGLPRMLKR